MEKRPEKAKSGGRHWGKDPRVGQRLRRIQGRLQVPDLVGAAVRMGRSSHKPHTLSIRMRVSVHIVWQVSLAPFRTSASLMLGPVMQDNVLAKFPMTEIMLQQFWANRVSSFAHIKSEQKSWERMARKGKDAHVMLSSTGLLLHTRTHTEADRASEMRVQGVNPRVA